MLTVGDMPSIWIAELKISPATADKISSKHGVQADEVVDAVVCVSGLSFVWDDDLDRGRRAIVRASIRSLDWLVVLYPDSAGAEDVWHLGSAYRA